MKKAIILVSFGSSNIEGIKNSIDILKRDIELELGDKYKVITAFTSNKIREKLHSEYNYYIKSLIEALDYLDHEKYEEIHIKPLYIFNGIEYAKINEAVKSKIYGFKKVTIGNAILKNLDEDYHESYKKISEIIMQEVDNYTIQSNNILFIGHGSKTSGYKEYSILMNYIKKFYNRDIYFGTLEGIENLEVVLNNLKNNKVREIVIVPLLLIPGKHFIKDITDGESSWVNIMNILGIKVNILNKCLLQYKSVRLEIINQIKRLQ